MAKAIAYCECGYCGKMFEEVIVRRNRKEADSCAAWARKYWNQCPECYREAQQSNNAKVFAELDKRCNFPEIVGVSDKQKAYAESRREQYVAKNSVRIMRAKMRLDSIDRDALASIAKERGKDEGCILDEAFRSHAMLAEYIALTCTDARTIIEML